MKLFSSGDPDVSESIVTAAYEKGINLFDVSDPYNYENAECEFGKIFKKKDWPRRNYIVCTKIYWGK
jgi:aryl-alcohol dehydrogenase-like predicted oxidoreductase